MKNWFLQLPRREQYLLLIAAFGVFILLIVNGVWRPISHDVKTLKESNRALSQDVVWMQTAVAKYKELKKTGGPIQGSSNLSAELNNTLAAFQLKLNRFQPGQNNEAQIWLENVSFDQLMKCLAAMENKGIKIEQLNVSRVDQPGLVRAKLKVSRG